MNLFFNLKFWILTIFLVFLYSSLLFAQYGSTIYLDPSNSGDPNQDGSFDHPYDDITDVGSFQSNTEYLLKRGTTMVTDGQIKFDNISNARFGAYGSGNERPIFTSSSEYSVRFVRSSNCWIDSIRIIADTDANVTAPVSVGGYWSPGHPWTTETKITNCEIANGFNGIRVMAYATGVEDLSIINCEIHEATSDGIWLSDCENTLIEGCHIYNVNTKWFVNLEDADGDCIHIVGDCNNWKVYNTILDKSNTGKKFCFIVDHFNTTNVYGEFIGNTLITPHAAGIGDPGSGMYLKGNYNGNKHTIVIERNVISGRASEHSHPGYIPTHAGEWRCDTMFISYNIFDSIPGGMYLGSSAKYFEFCNNTFISPMQNNNSLVKFQFAIPESKIFNNMFASNGGSFSMNGTTYQTGNNVTLNNSSYSTWNADLGIVSWQSKDFHKTVNDNGGMGVGMSFDFDSVYVSNPPDVGAFEYIDGTQNNNPPVILSQSFSIDENASAGLVVGVVEATDPDPDQTLTFSIESGNVGGAFSIEPLDGILSVANPAQIDFEAHPEFDLLIKVQDDGPGSLYDQATITITLNDINESPSMDDQSFSIQENASNGEVVGVVEATDPDAGQSLTFEILEGNDDGTFEINGSSGEIIVNDNSGLSSSQNPSYELLVRVTDDGEGNLSAEAIIEVLVLEVNQPPVIEDQDFDLEENSPDGAEVGYIMATDPNQGQVLTFSIVSGNTDNTFTLEASTGLLTVANNDVLNFELNPVFNLVIEVQDNGAGNLTDEADVVIHLVDVNEPPVIQDQYFVVDPAIGNGEAVGFVTAADPDQGQELSFSILSGNEEGIFGINAGSGELTVIDDSNLNFLQNPVYTLVVEVIDNGAGQLSDEANVYISTDEINQPPLIDDQVFDLDENSAMGTLVGVVQASDPNTGQTITFSIVSGNADDVFIIDPNSGEITLQDPDPVNFEENQLFSMVVKVTDDGQGNLSAEALVTVNVNDVNEPPVMDDQYFQVEELSPEGTLVGTVTSFDPDQGQSLSFSIVSGNTDDAFEVDAESGDIVVNNREALNTAANPVFILTLQVEDDGAGNLTDEATVVIVLTPTTAVNPVEYGQAFEVNIYPNPTSNYLNIACSSSGNEDVAIRIINEQGKVMYSNVYQAESGDFTENLNVIAWPRGMYIMQIEMEEGVRCKKILKI